jgi:gas vesicle protein
MSRKTAVLTMAGVAVVAGAVGCAIGLMFAPASGKKTRRRLAWQAEELRSAAVASGRFLEQAAARAKEELATWKRPAGCAG